MKEATAGPGHIIYEQNEIPSKFYFLVEGSIEVCFKSKENSQLEDKIIKVLKG